MTKRKGSCDLECFKYIISERRIEGLDKIPDESFRNYISGLTRGCFVLTTTLAGKDEALVMHKLDDSINCMLGKENLMSLKVRLGMIQ